MAGCSQKNVRFCATLMAVILCLTHNVNGQKNGFRGGAKSYEIHVEASAIGTNLHYQLPEAKVKAAGKAKQDWLVDNDNAEMISMNSPVLAVVSVKHPKFSTKGQWPGYKLKFKLPKDVSDDAGAKKTNFVRPATSEKHAANSVDKEESSAEIGESALGSGSELNFPQNEGPNSKTKEEAQGVRKIAKSPNAQRKPRDITDESKRLGSANNSGLSLQKFSGLLLPLEKLKSLRLQNPVVKNEMEKIVTHAKKVVSEAKTVLKDAASFVENVKSLVHGGKNVQLNEIADYARKAVEKVGPSELGLVREGIAIATGSADGATPRAKHAPQPAKHTSLHMSQLDEGSGKSIEEIEQDAYSGVAPGRRVDMNTSEHNGEAKTAEILNENGSSSKHPQTKTSGEVRKRRESRREREGKLENFFSSLEKLKDLLGVQRK